MYKKVSLTDEQKILLLSSRLTFNQEQEYELSEIVRKKMNWFEIFKMAIKNKVLGLLWYNLSIRDYEKLIPKQLSQIAHFYLLGTRERNKIYFEELEQVLDIAKSNNIGCIPLKGSYLIPHIYKEYGIRTIGDIDCMIKKCDIKNVRSIMNSIDYVQGEYNNKTNSFSLLSREKELMWKMKMNNLYPFKKISKSEYIKYTLFDFCFSLDLDLSTEPVELMIFRAEKNSETGYSYLRNSDFFIHLCCHLYKEATNAVNVVRSTDLNLIKFCDVREFIIGKMDSSSLQEAIQFAKDNNLEKAIYYSIFYLREIYCDGYESSLLDDLQITDDKFLYEYGDKNYGQVCRWKSSFWERLFSEDNTDELVSYPNYLIIE